MKYLNAMNISADSNGPHLKFYFFKIISLNKIFKSKSKYNDCLVNLSIRIKCILKFVCLFDLILYVPSTIFQLNRDGSSLVELVLS